jgi:DNA invertase Pin-like site-specific DNA recombinase
MTTLAVAYCRVSSDEQEREGYSIPAQSKSLREYAERKGIAISQEYVDVETARKPGRPGFQEMVSFFKAEARRGADRGCRTLLVEKTDRLYRNLKDYITIDELGIDVHFAKEGVVLSPDSHSSEKLMHGIKVLMAKNYVDNLGEEVRKGMREKAEQGLPPNKVPLGYRNTEGPGGRRIVDLDPMVAPVVRHLFEEYGTGRYSLESLAELAKRDGLFGNRSLDRISGTLYAVLTNPFFYGEFRFKDKLYKGVYEPLITKELWQRVQSTLRDRGTRKPRKVKHGFAFQNLIRCGHCGCALVGEIKKGRYIYYHCTFYKGKCPEPYVREEVLEEKFTEILRSLHFDQEVLELVRQAMVESHEDEVRCHQEALDRLRGQYDRLQRWIETAYEDRLDGRLDAATYDAKVAVWRVDQTRACPEFCVSRDLVV